MDNLELYNRVRAVPDEAKKKITGGRLSGMTDINPMWRIKKLTEEFGPCGTGWKTDDIVYETVPAIGLAVVVCTLKLYVKNDDIWSAPIFGVGGSMLIAKEKNGPYVDDEAYKKAYTDAISVACKSLGFGADVYWDKDKTKYNHETKPQSTLRDPDRVAYMYELIRTICGMTGNDDAWAHKSLENTIKKPITDFSAEDVERACDILNNAILKAGGAA